MPDTSRGSSDAGFDLARPLPAGIAAEPAASVLNWGPERDGQRRGSRVPLRWRDLQWIDFTLDMEAVLEAEPVHASAAPGSFWPNARPPASALTNTLRRFTHADAPPARPTARPIPGLARRYVRVPVVLDADFPRMRPEAPARRRPQGSHRLAPRSRPAPMPAAPPIPASAPARPPTSIPARPAASTAAVPPIPPAPPPIARQTLSASGSSMVVQPRMPGTIGYGRSGDDIAAPPRPPTRPAADPGPASDGAAGFASTEAPIAAPRGGPVGDPMGAQMGDGMAVPAVPQPAAPRRAPPSGRLATGFDGMTRRLARGENRLRVTATIGLTALGVAALAYVGGALIAGLAGTGDTARHAAPEQPDHERQAALHVPPAAPEPAAPAPSAPAPATPAPATPAPAAPAPSLAGPAPAPPAPLAGRAAFFLTRAKAGESAAQYDLAVLYARGEGVPQDYTHAATWFHAAAAQGNVAAEYNLGVLYESGLGVPANETEAVNWYRSAADQNYPAAQFNLARAYAEGHGTKQDLAAAVRWYQRAAAHGLPEAMVNLAILYERGNGVGHSPIDAYAWYSAAAERGDTGAKDRAAALFQQFNDHEKARAEGLAATIGAALDQTAPPS